ncbi:MAG: type II toxin-antitoxin system PemK/MazF family toxin [Planctomycetes bacterium]|nr:type II toxin-antitoxin system PemK/MazF family toxin [Planctomycetota bacterium]
MVIKRGEVWWAKMPEPTGSEPGYKHPVLVIQSDSFNKSAISTIISVVITSNTKLAPAPGNVLLPKAQTKLKKDSVANVSQVVTLDKSFLKSKIGVLNKHLFSQVESGLRLVLKLD